MIEEHNLVSKILEEINSIPDMAETNETVNNGFETFRSMVDLKCTKERAINNALNQNNNGMYNEISKENQNIMVVNQDLSICELSLLHYLYYHGFNLNESYGIKDATTLSKDQLNYGLDKLLELKLIEEIETEHSENKTVYKHRITSLGKATWENYKDKMEAIKTNLNTKTKQKTMNDNTKFNITISNQKGAKINFIRVIWSLCKKGLFVDNEGNKINDKYVFALLQEVFNIDLSHYSNYLSQSMKNDTMNPLTDLKNSLTNDLQSYDEFVYSIMNYLEGYHKKGYNL